MMLWCGLLDSCLFGSFKSGVALGLFLIEIVFAYVMRWVVHMNEFLMRGLLLCGSLLLLWFISFFWSWCASDIVCLGYLVCWLLIILVFGFLFYFVSVWFLFNRFSVGICYWDFWVVSVFRLFWLSFFLGCLVIFFHMFIDVGYYILWDFFW